MILATREDIDYPHIDWVCDRCGSVYVSDGPPDTDHCIEGHHAEWRPNDEQLATYVDLLESLAPGDGILVSGAGPAPLMSIVEEVGDGWLRAESIDSPARKVRWERGDPPTIEWTRLDRDHTHYQDVYHVDTVEVDDGR